MHKKKPHFKKKNEKSYVEALDKNTPNKIVKGSDDLISEIQKKIQKKLSAVFIQNQMQVEISINSA